MTYEKPLIWRFHPPTVKKRAPKLKLLPILEDITRHCTSRILTFITEIIFIHIFSTLVLTSISLIEANAEISKLHEVFKNKNLRIQLSNIAMSISRKRLNSYYCHFLVT